MEENLKFAVFFDYDNIEIGVRTTLGRDLDIAIILEGIKQRGEIVAKVSYGDWGHHMDATRAFSEFGVHMVQRDSTPRGDKNGADINLALDALEMAMTRDHINAFAIISGDSDFMSLVNKLKQYNKRVYIVGGKQFTSKILQRNCHEFISYESLLDILPSRSRRGRGGRGGGQQKQAPRADAQPAAQVMPLVDRALTALDVRGAQSQLGLLKSTMLQLDSAFSEKDYGVLSFSGLAEKLVADGYIKVNTVDHHHVVERLDKAVVASEQDTTARAGASEDQDTAAQEGERSGSSRRTRGRSRGRGRDRSWTDERPADEQAATTSTDEQPEEETTAAPRQQRQRGPTRAQVSPRILLQRLLTPHTDLLELGIPAREIEALIKSNASRFTPANVGFDDFTALLDFAEAEELLRSIPDDRNVLMYKPGDLLGKIVEEAEPIAEEAEPEEEAKPALRRRRTNAARRPAEDEASEPDDAGIDDAADTTEIAEEPKAAAPKKKAAKRKTAKKATKKAAKKKASKRTKAAPKAAAADEAED